MTIEKSGKLLQERKTECMAEKSETSVGLK
jgi:hypothetical protein